MSIKSKKSVAKSAETVKSTKAKPKGVEFYAVSYTKCDENESMIDSGMLTNIFSTREKAHNTVLKLIRDELSDAMECYDEDDRKDVFGTEDIDALLGKVVNELNYSIRYSNPDNGEQGEYMITKYSTAYIV